MVSSTPSLWFDGNAREAAELYVGIFPDSHLHGGMDATADNPSAAEGAELIVTFTLAGAQLPDGECCAQ